MRDRNQKSSFVVFRLTCLLPALLLAGLLVTALFGGLGASNVHAQEPGNAASSVIVRYLGARHLVAGASLPLRARVRDAVTSAPLAQQLVQFRIGSYVATAVTDDDGIASTVLSQDVEPGSYELVVAVLVAGEASDSGSVRVQAALGATTSVQLHATVGATWAATSATRAARAVDLAGALTSAAFAANAAPGQTVTETKLASLTAGPGPADIVFSFDSTDSMERYLPGVKAVAEDIAASLLGDGVDAQFAVVSHRDYPGAYRSFGYQRPDGAPITYHVPSGYPYSLHVALTGTASALVDALSEIAIGAGGDPPASYSRVLYEGVAELAGDVNPDFGPLGYRVTPPRVFVLFGDDVPHDNDLNAGIPNQSGLWSTGGDPGRNGVLDETSDPANIGPPHNDDLDLQAVLDLMAAHQVRLIPMHLNPFLFGHWGAWARRTGGVNTRNYDELQAAILAAIQRATVIGQVNLAASPGFESWLASMPTAYFSVTTPAQLPFALKFTPPPGTPPGIYSFTVSLLADGLPVAAQAVTLTVRSGVNLQVELTSSHPAGAQAGERVSNTVIYRNAGNVGANGVMLKATVSPGAAVVPAESTPGWQCTTAAAGVTCSLPLGSLPVGATGAAIMVLVVDSPLPAGAHLLTSTAQIADDGANGPELTPADNTAVTIIPLGRPPVATDDGFNVSEDSTYNLLDILANDVDPNGGALSVIAVSQPQHGMVAPTASGPVSYTPAADYFGLDAFTYVIQGGNGLTATATAAITVTAVNDPPVAVDDPDFVTREDQPVDLPVLANDRDGDHEPLQVVVIARPPYGTAAINPDGTIHYTPLPDWNGVEAFRYEISDAAGITATAIGTVTVRPVNDPPVAQNDVAITTEGAPVVVPVLANDFDPDLDALSLRAVTKPQHGVAEQNLDNTVRYLPAPGFVGSDAFTYVVADGLGLTATATVAVSVTPVVGLPDLGLAKTLAPAGAGADGIVTVGQLVTFTLVVTNLGETSLIRVPLRDRFAADYLQFLAAEPPPTSSQSGQIEWADLTGGGDWGPGVVQQVTVWFQAVAPTGQLPGQQTLNLAESDGAWDGVGQSTLPRQAAARIRITAPAAALDLATAPAERGFYLPGDAITVVLNLRNAGDTQLNIAPLTVSYPNATLEFVGSSVGGWLLSPPGSGAIAWPDITADLGDLPPSAAAQLTLTFRALAPATGVIVTAQLTGGQDENADPIPAVGANASFIVDTANMELTFSADPPPNSQVGLGARVVYRIAVENTGTVTVSGISVTSTAPVGMAFVSSEPAPDLSAGLHMGAEPLDVFAAAAAIPLQWTLAGLGPGARTELFLTVRVAESHREYVNWASVRSSLTPRLEAGPVLHFARPTALEPGEEPALMPASLYLPFIWR